jgi:hypothetical protein
MLTMRDLLSIPLSYLLFRHSKGFRDVSHLFSPTYQNDTVSFAGAASMTRGLPESAATRRGLHESSYNCRLAMPCAPIMSAIYDSNH